MTYCYNEQPGGFRLPEQLGLAPDAEQELRDRAWSLVVSGQHEDEDFFVELAEDDLGVDEDTAIQALTAVVEARRRQQAAWSPDEARTGLTKAFEALSGIGVVARENFSCCGTCGAAEIWDERDDTRTWRGYIYYHEQDTESLLESGNTYVGYGAFMPAWLSEDEWNALSSEEQDQRYGDIVRGLMGEAREILEQYDVEVRWDGDLRTRMLLDNVDYYVPIA